MLSRRLTHFIIQLEIENLGPKLVDRLVRAGLLAQPTDLFRLTREDLLTVERMGEKLADKLLANIAAARKAPLSRLIAALGIPNVGIVVAEDLARHFCSLASFRAATIEKFQEMKIFGIGKKVTDDVVNFLEDDRHKPLLEDIARIWTGPAEASTPALKQTFIGKTFVITGAATQPRGILESFVKERGGRVSASVSPKTSVLVIGSLESPDYTSSKKSRALELGILIIDEHLLFKMAEDDVIPSS